MILTGKFWKGSLRLGRLFLSPWFLACIWTFLLLLLLPKYHDKYSLTKKRSFHRATNEQIYIDNIYSADEYHFVSLWINRLGNAALKIRNQNTHSLFQANLSSQFPDVNAAPFIENLNQSKEKEISFLTQRNDSIFINIYEPSLNNFIIKELFVDTIGLNQARDYSYGWIDAVDINLDGIKEVYFVIRAGFALHPRRIYSLDISKKEIKASPSTGINFSAAEFVQFNDEWIIVSGSFASNNCRDNFPYPYPDNCSYAILLDQQLNFMTEPIGISGAPASLSFLKTIQSENQTKLLFHYNAQARGDSASHFFTIDGLGNYAKLNSLHKASGSCYPITINEHRHILINSNGEWSELDSEIKNKKQTSLSDLYNSYNSVIFVDINKDGAKEIVTKDIEKGLYYIFDSQVKNPVSFNLHNNKDWWYTFSTARDKHGNGILLAKGEKEYHLYHYHNNKWYWTKYPSYLTIYLLMFLFFHLVLKLQEKRLKQKQNIQKQISDLQLKNYRNQLDPHFAYNALNSIGSSILKEERLKAYDQFIHFSRLLGQVMDNSTEVFVPLKDELDFANKYLLFQKGRYPNLFDFNINISSEVDTTIHVPKMIIQGAVENSIKHGFYKQKEGGQIDISITSKENKTHIYILDNGIGIQAAQKAQTGNRGKGIGVMREQLQLLKKFYNYSASYKIIDLTETGRDGTSVEWLIPNYRLN